jgi:hypothetical protein
MRKKLRKVNRWCVRRAGVTLSQWLGLAAAFALMLVGMGVAVCLY